jgi:oxygen-independent coproporphyrinogen-3 oxidase
VGDRPLKFVYVGGGTPSFISAKHLRELVSRLKDAVAWDAAEEITFECEPGTLTQPKLETIREVGVTRLSLGVENFNDRILEENGRAHLSKEIYRVAPWIRALAFDQLNIDLIAGMVGETFETWRETVQKTVEMDPDSVTIYQMELPFNTVYSRRMLDGEDAVPVADWATKRAWHDYAFSQLEAAGYELSSAYTMVKRDSPVRFVYRDSVWHGCDLLGLGVASFSHVSGVHFQNEDAWEPYLTRLESGELPVARAFATSAGERLTRELILQLKLGHLEPGYFRGKFEVDVLRAFAPALERLQQRKLLTVRDGAVHLTRQGLLRVDTLLPEFYDAKYRGARYT